MQYDIFFSICQMKIDGFCPNEASMLKNFFDQVCLADELGYQTAWVAESHLSCQEQKHLPQHVIPEFEGEIGLNTDIFLLAQKIFSLTKNIHVGSAIRNILCNGGPIAHAEAAKMFLSLHGLNETEKRKLHLGIAAGRFPFSNTPYGIAPRDEFESAYWPMIKRWIFIEACQIFLKALTTRSLQPHHIQESILQEKDFASHEDYLAAKILYEKTYKIPSHALIIKKRWPFDRLGVIPFEAPLHLLSIILGTHDPLAQEIANSIYPCGVFNLSITPQSSIEKTHERMQKIYHSKNGPWSRTYMPRTVLVFLEDDPSVSRQVNDQRAKQRADEAISYYWKAMEGTIEDKKIKEAVNNALWGCPETIAKKISESFHSEDRLMLWFDFGTHDQKLIKNQMIGFSKIITTKAM